MTTPTRRVAHSPDEALGLRYERLQQAIASAALEDIEFTAEDLAELNWFDQQGMTDEEAVAYLISKYRQQQPFQTRSVSLGRCLVGNVDNVAEILARAEDIEHGITACSESQREQ